MLLKRYFIFVFLVSLLVSCGKEDDIRRLLPNEVTFSHLPTDINQMEIFGAIGQMRAIPKQHGGFITKSSLPASTSIPVYSMSDGIIIEIRKEPIDFHGVVRDEFAIWIAVSKEATHWYGHLADLSQEILDLAGDLRTSRSDPNRVNIEITAGQLLGYVSPGGGFDIGMWDFKKETEFANPGRYDREYRSAVPFTDYLPAELLDQVWSINPRTVEPRGGKINYDVKGTLSGNWFLEGTRSLTEWSKQLVFGRHELYGDRITIVDASPLVDGDGALNNNRESYIWFVKGNSPLPETITSADGKVKYEVATWGVLIYNPDIVAEGVVMVELSIDGSLKYEWFEGKSASQVNAFTSNARKYVR